MQFLYTKLYQYSLAKNQLPQKMNKNTQKHIK